MEISSWKRCLEHLEGDLSLQQFNTWIRPLQAIEQKDVIHLFAPNRFVRDWVSEKYLERIRKLIKNTNKDKDINLTIEVGNHQKINRSNQQDHYIKKRSVKYSNNLNKDFNFDNFVEGKSNPARPGCINASRTKPKASL